MSSPSVPGGTLAAALPDLTARLANPPQTVVLAFGMNDHIAGAAALPAFEDDLHHAVRRAQAAGARVILMGVMQQNTTWRLEDKAQTVAYNTAIARVAQTHGVVFLDVQNLLDRSAPDHNTMASRTGDFMHHPNSYGQQLHYALLLPHFITAPVLASVLPGYIDLSD